MAKTFTEFLKNHLVKKESNEIITNTRIGDKNSIYGGSYHIDETEYSTFSVIYSFLF